MKDRADLEVMRAEHMGIRLQESPNSFQIFRRNEMLDALLCLRPKIGTRTLAAAISINASIRAVAKTAGKDGIVGSGGVRERVDARSEVVTVRVAETFASMK
jgi:hypothetical protein